MICTNYKLDRKAKIAANIWQILYDNPDADPVIVAAAEEASPAKDDSSAGKNNGCNATVDSSTIDNDTILGSPVHSYNPQTLDIFLEDIPLYYKPSLGPAVKIHLIYSSSRTQTGSVGNKWFVNLDSKVIYNPDYTKDDFYGHEDHKLIFVSPNGRTDPCDLFELSPIISDDGQTVKPPDLWTYGYNSTDDDKPHYLNIFEAQIDEDFHGVNSDRQKHLLISFDETDSIALEARAIQRDGSLLIYKPVSADSQELLLSEERDKYGNAIFYYRNSNNQITNIIDSCGNETVIGWDLGRIYTITDPENNKVEFTYGYHSFPSRYLISSITDAAGFKSSINYIGDFVTQLIIDDKITNNKTIDFVRSKTGSGDSLYDTLTITDGEGNADVIQWYPASYRTRNKNNFWHKYDRKYGKTFIS
ncbi:MAG: hypothetical protein KAH48_11410, partial [Chlorobi bacterium]|nr:hypothetical protein [Chlorobiota bacterium]